MTVADFMKIFYSKTKTSYTITITKVFVYSYYITSNGYVHT